MRPFSQQALDLLAVETARLRSRRRSVAPSSRRVRRTLILIRTAVLVALTGALLLALATPVIGAG